MCELSQKLICQLHTFFYYVNDESFQKEIEMLVVLKSILFDISFYHILNVKIENMNAWKDEI